ncbi:MAG: Crp/Fnr family transcriptional regulator [Marinifilaceae bacterium]|jgi:signal-transduction protein with cAMP-binding, CBS, and nucleotidyltransferase domain|nr:Crp/Fnr family transcriptional regulator [Marinifilaceae bacterium]
MENVLAAIDSYYSLSKESKSLILDKLEPFSLKKGEVLLEELRYGEYLFFIEKGAVKNHYIDGNGDKKVVWFGFEGDISFSLNAYINMHYFHETTQLLEDSLFYRIKIKYMRSLYEKHCDLANWGRCFMEYNFTRTIKEMDEYKSRPTKDVYLDLINNNSNIRNRVPLKDIASYLGVSPVTISRLRKELGLNTKI